MMGRIDEAANDVLYRSAQPVLDKVVVGLKVLPQASRRTIEAELIASPSTIQPPSTSIR